MHPALQASRDIRNRQNLSKTFMLSKIYFETGDLENAKKGYNALLKNPVFSNLGNLYFVTLSDLGTLSLKEGDTNKAIQLLKQSVEVIESQRSTINTEASRIGFVGDKQPIYQRLVDVLFKEGSFAEAFEYVERSKARALVDMLASKDSFTGGDRGNSTEQATLLNELEKLELKKLINSGNIYRSAPRKSEG
ncbi:MAG: hypothetical protein SCARUB_03021 [Candidatus Scalindua rubra]|uniref:Tetratricopeptide repeat protein n=1 Tax=Candidatus Scalindua rubra TaxID=1872076 RepID=A0A1E3XA51_9BACT|nr:MAG: hypothetical protein SCARUB_03021 [Candidatus Scalindua rubra]